MFGKYIYVEIITYRVSNNNFMTYGVQTTLDFLPCEYSLSDRFWSQLKVAHCLLYRICEDAF